MFLYFFVFPIAFFLVLYPHTFKGLAKSVGVYIMDSMLGENKNLKDTSKDSVKDTSFVSSSAISNLNQYEAFGVRSGSYTKTNKLVTALYMVTDTMEKEEPIRLKLRTLGVEILSDISSLQKGLLNNLEEKIITTLSFLNIAFDIGMISEMNYNILRKEFIELKESIQQFVANKHLWFEEFINQDSKKENQSLIDIRKVGPSYEGVSVSKGHSTRIGVQKGSTLMKALSGVGHHKDNFEAIKKQRRESIIKIIKDKPNGVSIKDIIIALKGLGEDRGEKTLQRELISMVKDNVLNKTGEKRWSLYFLKLGSSN